MEYIKGALETLKTDTHIRVVLFISCIILLILRPCDGYLNMSWFYNKFTWAIIIITILLFSSLIVDFIKQKYEERCISRKKIRDKALEEHKRLQLEYYLFSLKGRKRRIVLDMYRNHHHRDYVSVNDSDTLDLVLHDVILPTKTTQRADIYGNEQELNELEGLFLLSPKVVQLIGNNKARFDL